MNSGAEYAAEFRAKRPSLWLITPEQLHEHIERAIAIAYLDGQLDAVIGATRTNNEILEAAS